MDSMFHRPFALALALSCLAASPAHAQLSAGDACPELTPGRVFTQEGAAGPALVCNGTTLEVYESVLTGPLRKGIGTATPQATLDISSTDSVLLPRGTTAERPGTPANGMIRYNSTTNKFEAYENGAWTNVIGGGSSLWTQTGSDIYYNTGKVGVGTASPAATLHVNGEAIIGNTSLSCSGTTEGAQRYNSTSHVMEFCNGTSWTPFAQVQSTSGPTAPAGSGYFVLTHTTWDGNLGGLAGADAKCLTELGTTYTSWRGYSTANSNGQITAGKVHAFLCERYSCNNLMPLTTYYFAYANSGTPGGASFTTDASGLGPGENSNAWSAANYFSGSYTYWTGRDNINGNTLWAGAVDDLYANCSEDWSDSGAGSGIAGNSGYTDVNRWAATWSACNQTKRLICFVNP